MHIQIGYDIVFQLNSPTTVLGALSVHPTRAGDLLAPEQFSVEPQVPLTTYQDKFDNIITRIDLPAGVTQLRLRNSAVVRDSGVHGHIRFDYMQARANRTALQGWQEGVGVCRDFAHLAVTLCRCMNIPARYATGYLGDIGVPAVPVPMDFSAWFEAYLGGQWWTFDARHNVPRVGRVLMARGRDAADVAIATVFGWHRLNRFDVVTEETPAP